MSKNIELRSQETGWPSSEFVMKGLEECLCGTGSFVCRNILAACHEAMRSFGPNFDASTLLRRFVHELETIRKEAWRAHNNSKGEGSS